MPVHKEWDVVLMDRRSTTRRAPYLSGLEVAVRWPTRRQTRASFTDDGGFLILLAQ